MAGIILDKSITPSPKRLKEMEYCKKSEWPSEVQSYLKKNIKYYKNQRVSFFLKKLF